MLPVRPGTRFAHLFWQKPIKTTSADDTVPQPNRQPIAMEIQMGFRAKLAAGEFIILAEMEPPKGVDTTRMAANARRIKGRVDAFLVPEMSNAVMRMSALGGALVLRQLGVETIMQVNCRDRNRIALQADLLAAGAVGVSAVVATTGEDPSFGDHHEARSVHDIDLPALLNALQGLKAGRDMAGI